MSLLKVKRGILFIFLGLLYLSFNNGEIKQPNNTTYSKKLGDILIHDEKVARSTKEAIIILPGFGDSKKGRKHQLNYFSNVGYDLYIPRYIERKSFEGTVEKFTAFFKEMKLNEYREIHIFSYVLGSWVINTFMNRNGQGNISTIVYDRSPLQELAPRVIVERIPFIGKIVAGPVLKEFSLIKYPPTRTDDLSVGIIVESKATPLIRHFRKTAKSYGSIDWNNLDLGQEYNDLIFTRLNHDEMYYSFDEIGEDILQFINYGRFTDDSRRESFTWDPYEKFKQ